MNIADITERKDRPAYVRFERLPVEDKAATKANPNGTLVYRDVDYALVTPPYSKDVFKQKVTAWFEQLDRDQMAGRIPQVWVEEYRKAYNAWKNGQELPVSGTPIRGWGVISPAQQETLIKMHVLTVEDLAAMNDEGARRVGMGAQDLKNKAAAWIAQMKDKGPLTLEMSAVKQENAVLKGQVETLTRQVQELMMSVRTQQITQEVETAEIAASDILEPPPVQKRPTLHAKGK